MNEVAWLLRLETQQGGFVCVEGGVRWHWLSLSQTNIGTNMMENKMRIE